MTDVQNYTGLNDFLIKHKKKMDKSTLIQE